MELKLSSYCRLTHLFYCSRTGTNFPFGLELARKQCGEEGNIRMGFPALLYVECKFKFLCMVRRGNGAQTRMTFIVWNEVNKHGVKLSLMWERIEIEALDSETRKRGTWRLFSQMRLFWWMIESGTVTESGKVRESHRLDQERLSRGDTQIGSVTEAESGKVTDWTRNSWVGQRHGFHLEQRLSRGESQTGSGTAESERDSDWIGNRLSGESHRLGQEHLSRGESHLVQEQRWVGESHI